jgi:hypothetical protein
MPAAQVRAALFTKLGITSRVELARLDLGNT